MEVNNPELKDILVHIVEWHKNRVSNCQTILDHNDADLRFDGFEKVLPADSIEAKWLRIGVGIALDQFKTCPIVLSHHNETEEENDE
ncbi:MULTISPECIES: hypothetical protein [Yersinia]|uniref:hypothetical protein n=1 Tax=Yersinia TaxID=629 RepID=UPI001427C245|nr:MULTISPECIES: hypothetical protein [Yersinia]MBX9498207.1 hypothetical protein [Yersinia enterocolitica]MCB5297522.1 hypothetical protein [Yersinia intermedia]MDA5492409.1 hypothetical protein [Yersinia intermedia]MDA5496210.1 hypothetical protein [Yersinia aleksiciae]NIL01079.1 hypothetical protein [Yersinia aleksiciae]